MSMKFNTKTGMFEPSRRGGGGKQRFFNAGEAASFLGWDVPIVSADAAIYQNLNRMKARCRDLYRNNDHIKGAVRLIVSNVIGPHGFRLSSKLTLKNGERDRAFNSRLQARWLQDGKLRHSPELTGRMNRRDIGALWMTQLVVDGEAILIKHPGTGKNRARFAVQFVDPARLDWTHNKRLPNGNEIRMGVEVDGDGTPVAYWFLNHDPNDYPFGYNGNVQRHTRLPASRVMHDFFVEAPNQTRGVPIIASPAVRAHMLARFEEAVVVGMRIAASKMGFYKYSEDSPATAPGDDEDYDLKQEIEPGMFEQLPRGVSVEPYDPAYPPAEIAAVTKQFLQGMASGIGVDYVSMSNNLEGVNYSSIRAGSIEQRAVYRALQKFYVEHCEERVFIDWLRIQQFQENDLPMSKVDRLLSEESWDFVGRGWQWVDPLKEVNAHEKAIALNLTSRGRIIAETYGLDMEDVLDEISEEKKLAERYGVELTVAKEPAPPASAPAAPPPEAEDDEE